MKGNCTIPGCDRPLRSRDMCIAHYMRAKNGKDLTTPIGLRKPSPPEVRLWANVQKTDGCWFWIGHTAAGYGRLDVNGKPMRAHRLSWELVNGPVPEGLWVLHKCDVRNCVNPEHLFLGTQQDNTDDAMAKGRSYDLPKRGAQARGLELATLLDEHAGRGRP